MALLPHLWTVLPRVRHSLRPRPVPLSVPWQGWADDPQAGRVGLNGLFRDEPGAAEALLVVHGLGGSIGSHYMGRISRAAQAAGLSYLLLNLRGSDRQGDDFYHAGLTADVHTALASPELARFERIYILGYSLGGHLVLRAAAEGGDRRLCAVAAVCSPLDLALSVMRIDAPESWLYRRYLLRALNQIYAGVAARRPVPIAVAAAERIRTIREWDERIVAPRHGFTGAADYYARESVAPRLGQLRVPSLLLNAVRDPMVPSEEVRPVAFAPALTARFIPGGGHVAFPRRIDLGLAPGALNRPGAQGIGLEAQLLAWLRSHGAGS